MNQYVKENSPIKQIIKKIKELKINTILYLSSFIALLIFGLSASKGFIDLLKAQAPDNVIFIQFSPTEVFFNSFEVALLLSLCLSLPFILYKYFLYKHPKINDIDKKLLINSLIGGFFLFLLGVMAAYYVFIPASLYILLGYSSGIATLNMSISNYISYCLNFIIIIGIIFEFPLYSIILKKTKFINYKKLTINLKKILIGIGITAFILTFSTPIFTFIFLAVTILLLYGFIIFITKIFSNQES